MWVASRYRRTVIADLADVENSLADRITATVYPGGVLDPSIVSSGVGLVDIRRGWPLPTTLDIAIASGRDVLVRIYPEGGMSRNTSRFTLQWREENHVAATLTVSTTGSVVTFGGTGDASHVAGVLVGPVPTGIAYAYRLLATDGPTQVAAALAALIPGSSASSGVLTIGTNLPVTGRVVNDQTAFLETRRQDQGFRISIWSANNIARDAVASLIDNALAYLTDANGNPTMNIVLADNSAGWLRYRSTYNLDGAEKAGLYRRDLCYMVEYATSLVQTLPEVLFGQTSLAVDLCAPGTIPQVLRAPVVILTA